MIRQRDLFGIPVQLTYKGAPAFNTICGGCVSIIMMLGFAVMFCINLYGVWFEPQFLNFPISKNYDLSKVRLKPSNGNTIAGLVVFSDESTKDWSADPYVRVQFHQSNVDVLDAWYDGVYCTDLYADQIAREKEDPDAGNDFTEMFADYLGQKWICPNVTGEIDIMNGQSLVMNFLSCDQALATKYAEGVACEDFPVDESKYQYGNIQLLSKIVSSNLDPELYHKTQQLQLYGSIDNWPCKIGDDDGYSYVMQEIWYTEVTKNKIRDSFFSSTKEHEV